MRPGSIQRVTTHTFASGDPVLRAP